MIQIRGFLLPVTTSHHLLPRKGGGGGGSRGSSGKPSSSSSSRGPSGKSGSISVSSGRGRSSASSSSRGGGTPAVLPSGSPFAGRLSGGATRDHVYGSSRIGSGYPYGGYGNYYGGRPFPYGFYPVYVAPDYYGGNEYGPNVDAVRPGGALSTALVLPLTSSNNASSPDSYYIVGDESSVSTVIDALISLCDIANASVTNTYPNGTLSANGTVLVPHPEQIVQFYRASSFALALSSYNNSAALPANAPTSNTSAAAPASADTPLPVGLNMTLFACLNGTIAASVPLLDVDGGKHGLSGWAIAGIVVGIIFVLSVVALLWCCYCGPPRLRNKRTTTDFSPISTSSLLSVAETH